MLMRVALFGADQRVADVPEDVVRKGLLATLEKIPGFEGAYFGVNPQSGRGVSVNLWATEDSLRASEEEQGALSRTGQARIPDPSSVERFEVAYRT